jgi:hypothetical protein
VEKGKVMKNIIPRLIGAALIVAAAAGMLFSVFALVQVWRIKPALVSGLGYEVDVIHATVSTTSAGLITVSDTMKTATENVAALQNTTIALAQSIHAAQPMMDTLVKLLGQDLPNTISTTQTSLDSAATSATLIDNLMGTISGLPLLGLDKYAPAVPLHIALGEVSGSLGNLTIPLIGITANLTTDKSNLTNIETEVTLMSGEIAQIKGNIDNARQVIIQYQQENEILLAQVDAARKGLPTWINNLAWFLSIALIWLFITQIGLLLKGWEMLFRGRKHILKDGDQNI